MTPSPTDIADLINGVSVFMIISLVVLAGSRLIRWTIRRANEHEIYRRNMDHDQRILEKDSEIQLHDAQARAYQAETELLRARKDNGREVY